MEKLDALLEKFIAHLKKHNNISENALEKNVFQTLAHNWHLFLDQLDPSIKVLLSATTLISVEQETYCYK